MAFEVFDSRTSNRRPIGQATLILRRPGKGRFSRDATQFLKEQGIERVLALWDADERKIGIAPAKATDKRSYKVSFNATGNAAGIAFGAFLKHIGIHLTNGSVRIPLAIVDGVLEGTVPRTLSKPHASKKSS